MISNKLIGAGMVVSGAFLAILAGIPLVTGNVPKDLSINLCVIAVLTGLAAMVIGGLLFRYVPEKRP